MGGLTIKAVTEDNLEQLLSLIADYQRFYRVPVDRERNRQFFSQFIRRPGQAVQHLGIADGEAAGFTTLYFTWCSLRAAPVATLYDLYVVPELRRRGFGRALLEHAESVARKHEMRQMVWLTEPGNHEARRLYDRVTAVQSQWVQYTLDLSDEARARS